MLAPIDTATLRRSTRNNKYDGFRVNLASDTRQTKSRVKPRVIPSALEATEDTPVDSTAAAAPGVDDDAPIPPPTPIPTMQPIGVNLCAVPVEELTTSVLSDE